MTDIHKPTLTLSLPIEIRLATYDDLIKLEWYGQYAHFRSVYRRTFREMLQRRRLMLIADCHNFPIGQVFVQLDASNDPPNARRAYLYALRVMEMFQGHGIGTHLLREAEQRAAENGCFVATIAAAKNNPRARFLYERLGYRVFAEDDGTWSYTDHENRVRHVHEPCWVLEKKLLVR